MGAFNGIELSDVELRGPRLTLRRWHEDDVDRVLEVVSDRSMFDFLTLPDPYRQSDARAFVTRLGHEGRDEGTGLGSAVLDADGRVVGAAALRLGSAQSAPDVGYWIAPDARGHGYAAEACRVLCDWGFDELGLTRLKLHADVRNLASIRTALAAGFGYEGTSRGDAPVAASGAGDLARFGRLATDPGDPIAPAFDALPPDGLRDGVITLRTMQPDDAEEYAEADDEVSVAVGFGDGPMSPVDAARRAARAGLDWLVAGRAGITIVDDATGAFAGQVSLRRGGPPGVGGIGYVVHPLFRGRGYTARALRLLAPWAFAHGFVRLELGAKVTNIASQRSAAAGGFAPDGVLAGRLRNPDGSYSDEARFVLLAPVPSVEVRTTNPPDIAQPL